MFSSRFMVLMLLGSIVTGPQRAWLSGSPVAQSVIFMPGRLFQRCYANRWTSLTPQWTPPLPLALLFILASSCNEPSPAFYIFLHHFLLENGAAFVWKQCRDFFFHARTTNSCPSAKYSIGVCKLNQLRSPRWKGAQSVEVLGRFCARQNNMNTIFSAHILVWIIPQ